MLHLQICYQSCHISTTLTPYQQDCQHAQSNLSIWFKTQQHHICAGFQWLWVVNSTAPFYFNTFMQVCNAHCTPLLGDPYTTQQSKAFFTSVVLASKQVPHVSLLSICSSDCTSHGSCFRIVSPKFTLTKYKWRPSCSSHHRWYDELHHPLRTMCPWLTALKKMFVFYLKT